MSKKSLEIHAGLSTWNTLHRKQVRNCSDLNFLGNKVIKPCSVTAVVLEAVCLQQLGHELHGRTKVTTNWQLLQCDHHVPSKTVIITLCLQYVPFATMSIQQQQLKCKNTDYCVTKCKEQNDKRQKSSWPSSSPSFSASAPPFHS